MQVRKDELFAYQLLHYFVVKQQYRIVRIQQHQQDLWLMNEHQSTYPVIRISTSNGRSNFMDIDYVRNIHRFLLTLMRREGMLLILNTNEEADPIQNAFLIQVCITPNSISDRQLINVFHGIDHVVHEVSDPQLESTRLLRQIEESQLRQRQAFVDRLRKQTMPKATFTLIGICILLQILVYVLMYMCGSMEGAIVAAGGFYKMNIVAAHEYWRLFSAGFVHMDAIHCIIAVYALYTVGKLSELRLGRGNFLLVLCTSLLVGNMALLIGGGNAIVTGISAGIFGVAAAYATWQLRCHRLFHPLIRMQVSRAAIALLLLALVSKGSLLANLAGGLCGILYGVYFYGRSHTIKEAYHACMALLLYAVCLIGMGMQVQSVNPLNPQLDRAVVQIYHHTSLNAYAEYLQSHYQQYYEATGGIMK